MANQKSYNQDEKKRSEFGQLLHQELLDATKERKGITQKQIALRSSETAKRSGRNKEEIAADELSRMITGDYIPNDPSLFNRLYAIFIAISELRQASFSEGQVNNILAAKEIKGRLSDQRQKELIARLKGELIIKDIRYTRQGIEFIGRERDIAEILTKLQDKRTQRFLTLTGAPGVGKSELARCIRDIAQTQEIFTNALFISLEDVYDVDVMEKAINDQLKETYLKQKTLLILDNCEQIKDIEKANEKIYDLVEKNPQLTILATSRVNISDGKPHEVETLPLPPDLDEHESLEKLQKFGAVQLFLESIYHWYGKEKYQRDIENNRALLPKICDLLDGLPLALLIASALIERKGGIRAIHKSLLDMSIQGLPGKNRKPKYHVTLDDLIEHSYKFLDEKEQRLLRWMAAFPLKCATSTITFICSIGEFFGFYPTTQEESFRVAEYIEKPLETLAAHNLIIYKNNLVTMHNIIRRFGRRMLNAKKEGYTEGEETKLLLSLLLEHNSLCRSHIYLSRVYNSQKLIKIAEERKFLEKTKNEHHVIRGELAGILFRHVLNSHVDCFRMKNPLLRELLDIVIKTYLSVVVVPQGDVSSEDFAKLIAEGYKSFVIERREIPIDDCPEITADERREVFFSVFDNCYKENLFTMLLSEGKTFLDYLFATYDLTHIWENWDTNVNQLIGLSALGFYTTAAPGNILQGIDLVTNAYFEDWEEMVSKVEKL